MKRCWYCDEVLADDSSGPPVCQDCRGSACVHGVIAEACEDCDKEELTARAEAEFEPDSWLDREEHLDFMERRHLEER